MKVVLTHIAPEPQIKIVVGDFVGVFAMYVCRNHAIDRGKKKHLLAKAFYE